MLVVLLFLSSLRKTFVIGLAIPIAILATFGMMGAGSLTLNVISLGGLALGVGLLIDNSIVMLENIFRHREEGNEDPEQAAHEGAAEVQSAVIAATATNLAAVVPFLLISGLAALIFRELILTISFAILGSLIVALTVVPMLSAQFAKVRFESGLHALKPMVMFDNGISGCAGCTPVCTAHPAFPLGRARPRRARALRRVASDEGPRQRVPAAGRRRQCHGHGDDARRRLRAGDEPRDH
jgi:multidrug efflux pump subunit AcrB